MGTWFKEGWWRGGIVKKRKEKKRMDRKGGFVGLDRGFWCLRCGTMLTCLHLIKLMEVCCCPSPHSCCQLFKCISKLKQMSFRSSTTCSIFSLPLVSLCSLEYVYMCMHLWSVCMDLCVCVCVYLRTPCRVGVVYPAVKPVDNWHHGQTLSSLSWPENCNEMREPGRETEGFNVT